MNNKELLRAYKKKIVSDLAVRSALISVTVSATALFLTSLLFHILMRDPPIYTMLTAACALFAVCFIVNSVISFRISERQVALRIDEVGLKERIVTMVEYKDNEDLLAEYQRRDAIIHLQSVKPSQLKSTVTRRHVSACIASVAIALMLCLLPYEITYAKEDETSKREKQILEIIDELRKEYTPELDEALKNKVEQILDKTEQELSEQPNAENDSEIINNAIEEIENVIGGGGGDSGNSDSGDVSQGNKPPIKDPDDSTSDGPGNGGTGEDQDSNGSSLGSGSASSSNGNGETDHDKAMTELIYDPDKGTVTYGEIYVFYYADYLEALKNGNIPEEMQVAVNEYFEKLAKN